MNKWITIKTSNVPGEMSVVQSYLADYDIPIYIQDELTYQVQPYAIGGTKLQVMEKDVERAIDLLIEGGFAKRKDYEVNSIPSWVVDSYEKVSSWFK